jgi:hypothetical protein
MVLSFERETGKWSGWKELAGICEFGETDYVSSVPFVPCNERGYAVAYSYANRVIPE